MNYYSVISIIHNHTLKFVVITLTVKQKSVLLNQNFPVCVNKIIYNTKFTNHSYVGL